MNPPSSNDLPELTAFALGELEGTEAQNIQSLLQHSPEAAAELTEIESVADALFHTAPFFTHRLTPDQREAVLHPVALPRRVAPLPPRQPVRRASPTFFTTVMTAVTKAAAVIALAGLAFLTGKHLGVQSGAELAQSHAPSGTPEFQPEPSAKTSLSSSKAEPRSPQAQFAALPLPPAPLLNVPASAKTEAPVTVAPASKQQPAVVASTPEQAPKKATPPAPAASVANAAAAPKPKAQAPAPASLLALTTPVPNASFVNASRKPVDQFNLRPASIRPAPVKLEGPQFAAPLPPSSSGTPRPQATEKDRTPDLYIHSWSADVSSCPWNEANRLLRVVVQLPADQPATASTEASYPLQVTFDPNNVRDYRLLCERHQPATEMRSAGTHILWYELQPNAAAAEPIRNGGARTLATITLPSSRFTTQSVGPFDSSRLKVMDRGTPWQQTRDDFVFESSVVGFGLLLQGTQQTGELNHQLVLNLARKAQGNPASPERQRFIQMVEDARKAAGL